MDVEDWKNSLHGGFAFQTADFGCHPTDAEFARVMFYQCLARNIELDEIAQAVQGYFLPMGASPAYITERIDEVHAWIKRMKTISKKKKAWLIAWDDDRPLNKRIISIKDSRTSAERIREFVQEYYAATQFPLEAKIHFSTRPESNPYPAAFHRRREGQIYCGSDPRIYARVVENLALTTVSAEEQMSWNEIDWDERSARLLLRTALRTRDTSA